MKRRTMASQYYLLSKTQKCKCWYLKFHEENKINSRKGTSSETFRYFFSCFRKCRNHEHTITAKTLDIEIISPCLKPFLYFVFYKFFIKSSLKVLKKNSSCLPHSSLHKSFACFCKFPTILQVFTWCIKIFMSMKLWQLQGTFTKLFHATYKTWMQQTNFNFDKIFHAACKVFHAHSQTMSAIKIFSSRLFIHFTDFLLCPLKGFIWNNCFSLCKNKTF